MFLNKPYYRITRPNKSGRWVNHIENTYILDNRYVDDRFSPIRVFHILASDLLKAFEFIEPCDDNRETYSHRIYELLLRASTEFESNCKAILDANGYTKSGNLNIIDYHKINRASRLSEYELYFNIWKPKPLLLKPFLEWNHPVFNPLSWYQDYNQVKHNRDKKFRLANVNNLMNAIAGLFIIIYSQFNMFSFSPFQVIGFHYRDENGFESIGDSIFKGSY